MTIDENKGMMNYKVVNEDLEKLFEAVANLLEREWDDRYRNVDSARVIFFTSVRIAINTYSTIMYICADTPTDPDRRPVYALSLPPLTRTLFEQLITFLFLIEDIPLHIPYLFRTGYTERKIELAHCVKYHGSDPIWRNYISSLTKQIALEENLFSLTPDEITNSTKKIGRWPTPGIMLNKLREEHPGSAVIPYIEYINSWLYRELSGQTHLNALGVIDRGKFFDPTAAQSRFGNNWEFERKEKLEDFRIKQIYIAITLMMAIVSEIESHFKYGRNEKARYLWKFFSEYSDIAKDFWKNRYSSLLPE